MRKQAWIELGEEVPSPLDDAYSKESKTSRSPHHSVASAATVAWKATAVPSTPRRAQKVCILIMGLCIFLGSCVYGLSPSFPRHGGGHGLRGPVSPPPFVVVIDAGSTGTKVHTYCFSKGQVCRDLDANRPRISATKPGLSSCADAECLSTLLTPLMENVVQRVPAESRASTPLALRATAGFRLLGRERAEALLKKIRLIVADYGFRDAGVEVMTGDDEGLLQWIAVNSLLGRLQTNQSTVAVLDLGGASTQIAYALDDGIETTDWQKSFIRALPLPGSERMVQIYEHSYLGYGLVAARQKIMKEVNASDLLPRNPCFPWSADLPQDEGHGAGGAGNAQQCVQLISRVLRPADCNDPVAEADSCDFARVWAGPGMNLSNQSQPVGCSFYFFGLEDAGAVPSDATSAEVTPQKYLDLAVDACNASVEQLLVAHPGMKRDQALWICCDLCYTFTLLTVGFGIEANTAMLAVKSLPGPFSNATSASWSLGLALQLANVAIR